MTSSSFQIRPELPEDDPIIDDLHETAFGPGRFARTAFRLREGVPHVPELSFVATVGDLLVGSVRLTAISVDSSAVLLLGPLTVHPGHKSNGAGKDLVTRALSAAKDHGHQLVLLVGDAPYYGPLGFEKVPLGQITLPGPVDPQRVLAADLAGVLPTTSGLARRAVKAR